MCLFDNGGVADAAAEHEVLYAEEKGESAKAAFIKDHLETNTNFYNISIVLIWRPYRAHQKKTKGQIFD